MGQGVSLSPDAQPEPVRDGLGATSHAAEALVQAVRRAASELPPGEVGSGIHLQDIMNDPSARAQAARWRSGGVAKKVGAAFARLVDSLHKLKPGWLDMSGVEPQPVDALPVRQAEVPQRAALPAWRVPFGWMSRISTWIGWKTMLGLVMLVLFPRAVAVLVMGVVRLILRALLVVLCRIFRELWMECHEFLYHASAATGELEDMIVTSLESFFGWPNAVREAPTQPPFAHAGGVASPAPAPLPISQPARPMDLLTLVLLVFNLYRPNWIGGAGNGR